MVHDLPSDGPGADRPSKPPLPHVLRSGLVTVKGAADRLLTRSPLPNVRVRRARRRRVPGRLLALNYHGVVERHEGSHLHRNFHPLEAFREHVRYLRSLPVLDPADFTLNGEGGLLITFDDGFRNNLIAAEILDEAGLPWVVFVPPGLVETGRTIWPVELSLLLQSGSRRTVELFGSTWDLSPEARRASDRAIRGRMKTLTREDRIQRLEELTAQYPSGVIDEVVARHPEFAIMSWQDLKQLQYRGVSVGGHGMDHEMLHERQLPSTVEREVVDARRMLGEHLETEPRLFAYPDGQHCDASRRSVAAAGYVYAFTTEAGVATSSSDPVAVPRITPPVDRLRMATALRDGLSA